MNSTVVEKRKSLKWVIVTLAGLAVVVTVANVRVATAGAPADPRAGITCMDDAGGGVYCWEAP